MSTNITNRYPGNCRRCGQLVPVNAGVRFNHQGRWATQHLGPCPTTDPSEPTQPRRGTVTPTAEQAECVALFATGEDLVIQAGAGTGKTSTLLLLADQAATEGRKGQYTAYNKAIVEDVAKKIGGNVSANTMHSLAYRAIGHQFRARLNAPRQRASETAAILGLGSLNVTVREGERNVTKNLAAGFLSGLVLGAVKSFCSSAERELTVAMFRYVDGLDMPDDAGNRTFRNNDWLAGQLLPFAQRAWADLTSTEGRLRMSHDIYLKMWQLGNPTINADFILLDEAQDADPVQVSIIEQQRKFGTQIVVVGDSQQVLYEWRGAVNALAQFEEMGAKVAYLSQSFRFGNAIAEVANDLLARLYADLRLRGYGPVASVVGPIAEPTAVLCRTNAGAVRTVLSALEDGTRTHLVGGGAQVVAFCEAALDLQAGRRTSFPELACFDSWAEVELYVTNDEQGADLKLMVKLINDFGAATIIDALANQPREEDADLVVSTAHKSKGRQWSRVQIANDFVPPKDPESEMPASELRLLYVATTRAQHELDLTNVPHALS
jgi:hypothetical protein